MNINSPGLFDYLNSVISLTPEEISEVKLSLVSKTLQRGEFLAEEDKVCDHIAYIHKGYFRFYLTQDVDEITTHLSGPGEFISSFSSFLTRQPSAESVQAVTEAEVFLLDHKKLQELYDKNHRYERIGRRIIEKYFIAKDKQVVSFIKDPAENRYKKLLAENPEFILNIPLQYIASFLGIKPETLSRIRAKAIS